MLTIKHSNQRTYLTIASVFYKEKNIYLELFLKEIDNVRHKKKFEQVV